MHYIQDVKEEGTTEKILPWVYVCHTLPHTITLDDTATPNIIYV